MLEGVRIVGEEFESLIDYEKDCGRLVKLSGKRHVGEYIF